MSVAVFNRLNVDTKLELLMHMGVLLVESVRENKVFRLFFLHRFYVEVVSNEVTDKVVRVRAFDNIELLEPYLSEIDLSALIQ